MPPGSPQPPKPTPAVSWTYVTDAPLRGMALAREAGRLLTWDEAEAMTLVGPSGDREAEVSVGGKILSAHVSDDGSLVGALLEGPRLVLFSKDLEPVADRSAIPDASVVAIDPLGRYVAVSSRLNQTQIYSRHGRPSGKFGTTRPLAYLGFVPGSATLLGGSSNGWITAMALAPAAKGAGLSCEPIWQTQLLSNLGRLACTGDGSMILASCFNHGVQRYDLRGMNEGAYHLGGTASMAVPDFAGRSIVVATQEGDIALLNQGGNVRWKTTLPRPAIALEMDALGRFFLYGASTGEVRRVDLDPAQRPPAPRRRPDPGGDRGAPRPPSSAATFRTPSWTATATQTLDQAETAVLAVLDDPPRVALITSANILQVISVEGDLAGQAPQVVGVGRVIATAPGWIAASTDRMAALYDARRDSATRLDLAMVDMTHVAIRPDTYGLTFVQERDRVGRVTPASRWVWKRELDSPVEGLAINADGLTAVTLDDGRLVAFDPGGERAGAYRADPPESLLLIEAPRGAPEGVEWITLARRAQVLRGHRGDGRVAWESPVPFESWRLARVGSRAVVSAPDGRAIAFDSTGHARGQGRAEADRGHFLPAPEGDDILRIVGQGEHLICTDLAGKVRWRHVADGPIGPIAAGRSGVAALIGRDLAWFPAAGPAG